METDVHRFLMDMCLIKMDLLRYRHWKKKKQAYDNAMEESQQKEDPSCYIYKVCSKNNSTDDQKVYRHVVSNKR